MRIEFLKMHGLGNDFIIFDAPARDFGRIESKTFRALGDRHTGIGFDQALMLEAPRSKDTRTFYRIFNSDGSEVEQCGNGARCVAALLYARDPDGGREIEMDSTGGRVHALVRDNGQVSVNMGEPNFDPVSLPFETSAQRDVYRVEVDGSEVEIGAVSMGNPHAVLLVADVSTAPVHRLGAALERHERFANRTNVGFMQVVDRRHIRLRVFERGAGETLACGTGACAAVAVGRRRDLLDAEVRIDLKGGRADISWPGPGNDIWLSGPVATVFAGSVEI